MHVYNYFANAFSLQKYSAIEVKNRRFVFKTIVKDIEQRC